MSKDLKDRQGQSVGVMIDFIFLIILTTLMKQFISIEWAVLVILIIIAVKPVRLSI